MEFALSAITGDLLSLFISFLIKKCTDRSSPEEKLELERLQHLLLRLHTVVEEADGRYITNSKMLVQLRMIIEAMYRGYHVLDNFKYKPFQQIQAEEQVSSSYSWFSTPTKRFRTTKNIIISQEAQDIRSILVDLETTLVNIKEFVILLGGCERMCQRPYDTYLYIDNFMFGRVVEKQKIINVLLQDNPPNVDPVVLPIIGGCRVGKKTLVCCACNDNKIRSYYSSILHIKGDEIWRMNLGMFRCTKTLVVIEFISDITDEDWANFYSSTAWMGKGSKIIIISRSEKFSRFGTVKPIHLSSMSPDEYIYLFKVLAFGSANPEDNPQLAIIGQELGTLLGGLLLSANVLADMLRKNLDLQFWLHIFRRYRKVVDNNFSVFGAHPRTLHDKDHPVDITKFVSTMSSPLRIMSPCSETDICRRELSSVTFGDLVAGSCAVLPRDKFQIMVWESRIPPFTKFVATCVEEKVQYTALNGKKRQKLDG